MNTTLAIYAALTAIVALLLLWWRRSEGKQLALMAATPTSAARDVARLPPGSFVEVKGTLRCTSPIASEFAQRSCAYFNAEIFERRTRHTTDSAGKSQSSTTSHSIQANCRFSPCAVEDGSGGVALNLDGAEVEGETTVERTEHPGGDVVDSLVLLAGADRTEYRHVEKILPYDVPVYVLGEVQTDGSIGKPAKGSKNKVFLVSIKSEEDRSDAASGTMKWLGMIAGALFVVAAGLLVWAKVKGAG